ncbi:hypothetical protein BGI41_00645 [Methanobrevibacter sp. 87.7]|uniref:ATP-grasp domain-containing protein n=1 Tax=Methanobrevibacter sp. 87.7 TaxID=387957 RepID=UPI000B50D29D|nr:ATP-grasp domain-containing protein [Methanobrevibacter sp. 87.7]OWT33778.1 hypothetical protein BGI41_00645 [Methanobrevibacter sp. 87.7]
MEYDLSNVNKNFILVFEYYTATGLDDLCISSEAAALISGLVDDLVNEDVYLLLSKKYSYLGEDKKNIHLIILDEDKSENALEDFLIDNVSKFSRSIFISSEEDNNLYDITRFLEDNNVKLYVSDTESTRICSDKFETFMALQYKCDYLPLTYKVINDPKIYWKKPIEYNLKAINVPGESCDVGPIPDDLEIKTKLIAKPLNGVDCEKIKIISNKSDIDELDNLFPEGNGILIQEFIEGEVLSVSLLSDGVKALPISLNKQHVNLENDLGTYLGGELPYNHPAKDKIFDVAKKVVESIEGLKGFVGVDLIVKEEDGEYIPYVIEINSRFTTPYVGLRKVLNINIGQTILDLIDGKLSIDDIDNLSFKSGVKFIKKNGQLNIETV